MYKVCTLGEKRDWTRDVVYNNERRQPDFFTKQWWFVSLTTEQIQEIEEATVEKVQQILKTL